MAVFMFVALVYAKRNVDGLPGAIEIILAELTKRVHQICLVTEVERSVNAGAPVQRLF